MTGDSVRGFKTALVTGGAKRIGAAICTDLARNGFNLAIQYTSSGKDAKAMAASYQKAGLKAAAIRADLSSADAAVGLFSEAKDLLGPIDLVVNNASVFEPDSVLDFDEHQFDLHMALHLKSPARLAAALAAQPELDTGLVVNMIDQRVLRLNPNFFSYTLSKAGLWTATRTMAQGLAPKVRVNAIGPGPTLQNARQTPEDFARQVGSLILKKGPELEEFGRTIRYLYDTRSITGQMIALDGGQHLAWETPDIVGIPE